MNELMNFFQTNIWAFFDAIVTTITVYGVGYNYFQNKKQLQPIKIFIKKGNKQKEIPTYIIRRNFTRADIKGILSELHNSEDFFKIHDITQPIFLKKIFEIQQGKGSELIINIYPEDFFEYEI